MMYKNKIENLRRHYQLADITFTQKLFFMVTLYVQPFCAGNLYDEIVPGLFLGRIPTIAESHFIKEKNPHLGVVVSVVEDFELNGKVLSVDLGLQTPANWQKLGVKHHQLIATDFTADMSIDDTITTLKIMRQAILNNQAVYTHCKAGRGRSATLVLLYLFYFGSKDGVLKSRADIDGTGIPQLKPEIIQELYQYIKSKRTQVGLHKHNFATIEKVIEAEKPSLLANIIENYVNDPHNLQEKLNRYIQSLECKEQIGQLNAFKHLKFYGIDKKKDSYRGIQIQELLNTILEATDAQWFFELFMGIGPLQNLLAARPLGGFFGSGKPNKRMEIVEQFKQELLMHFAQTLNCEPKELLSLVEQYKGNDLKKDWQYT